MKKILVVCLGNICRSPVGEAVLKNKFLEKGLIEGKDFYIDSAGTGRWHVGAQADRRSQAVCASHGIDYPSTGHANLKQVTEKSMI